MKKVLIILIILCSTDAFSQKISTYNLTSEYKENPMGLGTENPRLSWKLRSSQQNVLQTAYEVNVATDKGFSKKNMSWSSGKVSSDQSVLVKYNGEMLKPSTRYYWRVRVWDNHGNTSQWSDPAFFETGLNETTWKAKWIEPVQDTSEQYIPALYIRKEVSLGKKVAKARAYVTSHGLYNFFINGEKIGDQVLTPGWTSYKNRLQYQVYDVTSMLNQGKNAIGASVGDGWYRGALGWVSKWGIYGKFLGLLAQINIDYTDGTSEVIITDESWKATSDGPIRRDGIYYGEDYDATREMPGWNKTGFDDKNWQSVKTASYPEEKIIATQTVPVRKIQEIKPIKIFRTPKGTLVADMGQNMVGWVRLKVNGKKGDSLNIRHAEVLDKFGEFYTENLRAANASVSYVMKGGEETIEPNFTFMGFRYVSIDHYPGDLKPEDLTGVVIHSDMDVTGHFACSDSLVNQLQHNIQWGQKGNFLDVPTDCPQRDERLGWTGDAQAFCRTAAFNMDVASFFTKWLKDVAIDQNDDGSVPFVIPDVLRLPGATSAGWGDVALIAPMTMFKVYGDTQLLRNQYESMKAYVDFIINKSGDSMIWKGGSVFGDWLYYKPKMENHTEPDGYTNPDMIATAFFGYSASILAEAAGILGNTTEQQKYAGVFDKVKKAFIDNYVTPEGRVFSDSQTGYVLALMFHLLPAELEKNAASFLVNDIRRRNNHLSTGFLGTPYLCHVLTANGYSDVAYDLLLQETFPSWLYPVKMGATTIWERWDGQKTDSTFQDVGMNSFNHYAYGAIGDWMYRVSAGIEEGAPGYKKIIIQPHPSEKLSFANADFESSYGKISSGWKKNGNDIVINAVIPPNTTAKIVLPGADVDEIKSKNASLKDLSFMREGDSTTLEVGSGEYTFHYTISQDNK